MAYVPRNDVRGVNYRVAVQRSYPNTAQSAAVSVGGYHRTPEALIPDGGTVRLLCERLSDSLPSPPLQKLFAVQERFAVHDTLLGQRPLQTRCKVGFDHDVSQEVARFWGIKKTVESFVQPSAEHGFFEP